jgi:hypothetical protein
MRLLSMSGDTVEAVARGGGCDVENNAWSRKVELQEVPLGSENHPSIDSLNSTPTYLPALAPHSSMLWDIRLHLSA